jgi:hypothetical protein
MDMTVSRLVGTGKRRQIEEGTSGAELPETLQEFCLRLGRR